MDLLFCYVFVTPQARVYLLSSGFSLAFGSMFAKTYRVHRIFTHRGGVAGGLVCKDKMLRDTQLISLVCALLLLDALVVTLWVAVDPMQRHLSNLTLEISLTDRSVVYQPQVNGEKTFYVVVLRMLWLTTFCKGLLRRYSMDPESINAYGLWKPQNVVVL